MRGGISGENDGWGELQHPTANSEKSTKFQASPTPFLARRFRGLFCARSNEFLDVLPDEVRFEVDRVAYLSFA
jgi:hypothetical protein